MNAGNLVKNKHASIDLPRGTVGLIVSQTRNNFNDFDILTIKFFNGVTRTYQINDLEVISG